MSKIRCTEEVTSSSIASATHGRKRSAASRPILSSTETKRTRTTITVPAPFLHASHGVPGRAEADAGSGPGVRADGVDDANAGAVTGADIVAVIGVVMGDDAGAAL